MTVATSLNPTENRPRVLIVDDDVGIRNVLQRCLRARFDLTVVESAEAGIKAVGETHFDVLLSDVHLEGMDGVELLRRVREHDLDLPVILMTGAPSLETAVKAIEHGALRYLFKPFNLDNLREVLVSAVEIRRLADARRQSLALLGKPAGLAADRAGLDGQVTLAIKTLRMAYQPIVSWKMRRVVGYEALLRTSAAALREPEALIDAATAVGRQSEIGRAVRAAVASSAAALPPGIDLFVNVNPQELLDDALYDPAGPLSAIASRVVLEVTERASLSSVPDVRSRVARLKRLGFRIAIDDLGAGYAGLASFAQLEPSVVKIDMALVRDVHRNELKAKLVGSMASACRELGITVVAEGVELPAERDALADLGCELLQGYLFARPGIGFPEATF
jgi:EAL domain-containing protein (putative c-di-GMP-specific phosphodiesterase class I)/ActR/RegA family two-component response regulator